MEISDIMIKILGGICIAYGIFTLWRFSKLTPQGSNNSTLNENDNTSKHSFFSIILTLVLSSWIISSFIAKVAMVIGIGILFWGAISIWIFQLLGVCMLIQLYIMAFSKNIPKDEWDTPIRETKKPDKNEMMTLVIVLSWISLWSIVDMAISPQAHPVNLLCQYFL